MKDGITLVFRKLEQDLKAVSELIDKWATNGCTSRGQMSAKSMGRWARGALVAKLPERDLDDEKKAKTFSDLDHDGIYSKSHSPAPTTLLAPEPEFLGPGFHMGLNSRTKPDEKPGLLFACYKSHIEDGFQCIQNAYASREDFILREAGLDPSIGKAQTKSPMTIRNAQNKAHKVPAFPELVTMRGGE
ncbi:uncharacterized protein Z519_00997 [Cladophialophora bantiana CBS 173.52]|uniref:Dyp-type peroxidase n=1 Tax=Cladophialophora bantiana (strain ATCC 10958 / CBS 173.52 / CDC B-1940 / NIH 8579) TaxID=1442370 RepID=A0A0D2IRE6_CLAB1|nr:uncharacterized protein Z519_00997 [Cladophialophora bantiana CBS 173.52]KIW99334.1 hypothetical protein Z519_00997 [Cladophialophora bantiana CBS 173.52]